MKHILSQLNNIIVNLENYNMVKEAAIINDVFMKVASVRMASIEPSDIYRADDARLQQIYTDLSFSDWSEHNAAMLTLARQELLRRGYERD